MPTFSNDQRSVYSVVARAAVALPSGPAESQLHGMSAHRCWFGVIICLRASGKQVLSWWFLLVSCVWCAWLSVSSLLVLCWPTVKAVTSTLFCGDDDGQDTLVHLLHGFANAPILGECHDRHQQECSGGFGSHHQLDAFLSRPFIKGQLSASFLRNLKVLQIQ